MRGGVFRGRYSQSVDTPTRANRINCHFRFNFHRQLRHCVISQCDFVILCQLHSAVQCVRDRNGNRIRCVVCWPRVGRVDGKYLMSECLVCLHLESFGIHDKKYCTLIDIFCVCPLFFILLCTSVIGVWLRFTVNLT